MRVLVEAGRAPPIDPGLCAAFRTATPDPNNLLANLRRSERSPYLFVADADDTQTRQRERKHHENARSCSSWRNPPRPDQVSSRGRIIGDGWPDRHAASGSRSQKSSKDPAVEPLRSRLRHVVQQSLRQGMGREERHRGDRRQHQSRADPLACRGRGVGAKGARPRHVPVAALSLRAAGHRHEGGLSGVRKEARQTDRPCRQEHLQPKDQEVLRLLRQLRPRSDQLPLGPMGRDRHEAGHLGRHPRRRQEDQGQDRHSHRRRALSRARHGHGDAGDHVLVRLA